MTEKCTSFMDMHSGGYGKTKYDYILVEAPEEQAMTVFETRFQDPYSVACTCCGSDYAVIEYDSLEEAKSYATRGETLVIPKEAL